MLDKSIARKYIEAIAKKELSYILTKRTGEYSTDGHYAIQEDYGTLLSQRLTDEERATGFGKMLIMFGRNWSNDCQDMCQEILGDEYYKIQGELHTKEFRIVCDNVENSEDEYARSFWEDRRDFLNERMGFY